MMNWLRGQVAKMIFGVLLLAFLAWTVVELGMQGRLGSDAGSVASVNGERVASQEFWTLYNQDLETTWSALRPTLTESDERELRRQVLDRLVHQTLVWQEAKRLKIGVSPAEVEQAIRSYPTFVNPQTGQFDPYRYAAALSQAGLPKELFEMEQERGLSAGRLEAIVRESVRTTDLELWLEYLRWHRRLRASLLLFPLKEAKAKARVEAKEIKDYWEANRKREFEKPERVRIRHLVVAVPQQGGPEADAQAKARMEAVVKDLKSGKDFAQVAREKSDDANTAPRGGDLGWRVRGELIPEYDSVVFTLKTGQRSPVFKTKFGYHLIHCEAHEREEKPAFEQVREKIRDRILTARARAALGVEAVRASWAAKREKDLGKVAGLAGRRAVQTGWFSWGKAAPAGLSATQFLEVVKALSSLEVGEVSELVETPEGFFLVQLLDEAHERAPEAGFLKDRPTIEPVLLARKQRAALESFVASLKAKSKVRTFLEGG